MALTGTDIGAAAKALEDGKLVGLPTETVYGLGANALDDTAVLSIFTAKNRPFFDPLIVHISDISQLPNYSRHIDERLFRLASHFWPGPLTLLLPKTDLIPNIVTSGLERVALRVPAHPLTLQLLKMLPFPLAAPSANPFGYVSPTTAQHVNDQLGDKLAYILDGGACGVGLESTIVGVEDDTVCVYRLGGLSIESIEAVVGKVELALNVSSDPRAPGQLKNHYAPRKPLFVGNINQLLNDHPNKKIGIITFGPQKTVPPCNFYFNLSDTGNTQIAAMNLFRALREADAADVDLVIAEVLPDEGLGRAINDRLKRASVR